MHMARTTPYHSINGTVHHVYTQCTVGNNIERDKRRDGTGNLPLCSVCHDIDRGLRDR